MKTSSDRIVHAKVIESALTALSRSQRLDFHEVASESKTDLSMVSKILEPFLCERPSHNFLKVSLAIEAVRLGEDPQRIARLLSWKELEIYTATLCRLTGLRSKSGVRITLDGIRAEVDVLASSPSLCLVIDCKRWNKTLSGKTLHTIVEQVKHRTQVVKTFFERKYKGVGMVCFAPVVVSLYEPVSRNFDGVFIVPVTAIKGFLLSVENVLSGLVYRANLDHRWVLFFEEDTLNQSLDKWR
ncbi:MAG: hypothetical protein RMI49_00560 [Candidatus Caldarchaeum sp.]|nr:hypothetical protein [Candidatus Caldarchaeum sp.]